MVLLCHKLIIVIFAPFGKELLTESKSSFINIPDLMKADIKDVFDVITTGETRLDYKNSGEINHRPHIRTEQVSRIQY